MKNGSKADILVHIATLEGDLKPAEQLVAHYVLTLPESVLQLSMRSLGERAGVSDASVLRFCRLMGCKGFPDFKIAVARSLAFRGSEPAPLLAGDAHDVFAELRRRADSAFAQVGASLDFAILDSVAGQLLNADRIGIFGYGASAVTALDLQHRLARLGLPVDAESDPHVQTIRVMSMTERSVAVFFAHGHSRLLTDVARLAVDSAATTVAIASPNTPIAKTCQLALEINVQDDTLGHAPSTSRLAHILVVDTLLMRLSHLRGDQQHRADGLEDLEASLHFGF